MNAPVPPGPGNPGDATGGDPEQGSESEDGDEDVTQFEVESVILRLDSTSMPLQSGDTNSVNHLNRSETIGIEVIGTDLSQIKTAVMTYSDGYNSTDLNLVRQDNSTETDAWFKTRDFPKDEVFYIDAVALNGEYVFDKRQAVKKVYISGRTNNGSMGYVTGDGLKDFGTEVTLVPVATNGHHFVKWEDDYEGVNRTFVADHPYAYTAIFEAD